MTEPEDDLIEQFERGVLRRQGIDIETDPLAYKEKSPEQRHAEFNKAIEQLREKSEPQ